MRAEGIVAALALLAQLIGSPTVRAGDPADLGSQLYHSGRSVTGRALTVMVQGDVPLPGAAAACVNCHRRSGLGTAEGLVRPLPITGPALFNPRVGARSRPTYTDATLTRAITAGIGADGKPLGLAMPRYALDAEDQRAIVAYLRTLGGTPPPGVTEGEITLATVVADSAPVREQLAVERVLQRYVAIKNGGSRQETRRAAAARRHSFGDRHDRAYRHWRLAIWRLTGPPADWDAQLQHYYSAETPFALLSGAAGQHWGVVHRFCERQRLPCVLPLSDNPPEADRDFYSVYFTAGVELEARITAKHISDLASSGSKRVLVVRDDDPRGGAAWKAFASSWIDKVGPTVRQHVLAPGEPADAQQWQRLLAREQPDIVIAWIAAPQLNALQAALSDVPRELLLYTAESFTDWTQLQSPASTSNPSLHVFPYRLAQGGARAQFPREEVWLKTHGLGELDVRIAGRVLFACHALGEQLAGIESNFSRDYFIEGLEHMLDGTSMTSLYPRTTLGQGQRFLSRGAYVIPVAALLAGSDAGAAWIDM